MNEDYDIILGCGHTICIDCFIDWYVNRENVLKCASCTSKVIFKLCTFVTTKESVFRIKRKLSEDCYNNRNNRRALHDGYYSDPNLDSALELEVFEEITDHLIQNSVRKDDPMTDLLRDESSDSLVLIDLDETQNNNQGMDQNDLNQSDYDDESDVDDTDSLCGLCSLYKKQNIDIKRRPESLIPNGHNNDRNKENEGEQRYFDENDIEIDLEIDDDDNNERNYRYGTWCLRIF